MNMRVKSLIVGAAIAAGGLAAVPGASASTWTAAAPLSETVSAVQGVKPQGHLDSVRFVKGQIEVRGWAGDSDGTGNQKIHIAIDGEVVKSATASVNRPDVARAHPSLGVRTGFAVSFPAHSWNNRLCVYAINQGPRSGNVSLGCRELNLPAGTRRVVGALEPLTINERREIQVTGWAVDPDYPADVQQVWFTMDGTEPPKSTWGWQQPRPDLAAAHPGTGVTTGFFQSFQPIYGRGVHKLCAVTAKDNISLGCESIETTDALWLRGHIDSFTVDPADARKRIISGWVLEPGNALSDTPFALTRSDARATKSSKSVTGFVAGLPRPDVDRAYPKNGKRHGFKITVDTKAVDWKAGDQICFSNTLAPDYATRTGAYSQTTSCARYPG